MLHPLSETLCSCLISNHEDHVATEEEGGEREGGRGLWRNVWWEKTVDTHTLTCNSSEVRKNEKKKQARIVS